MSDAVSGITQLIPLIQAIGPLGTVLTALGLSSIFVGAQLLLSFSRRKGTKKAIENAVKVSLIENSKDIASQLSKIENKVDITIEGQSYVMASLEDITEAIAIINEKLANEISKENMSLIMEKFINGYLFAEVMESVMIYASRIAHGEKATKEVKDQLHLDLINIFDAFLAQLEYLKSSVHVARVVGKNYYREVTETFFPAIITIMLTKNDGMENRYNQVKAKFRFLTTKIIATIGNSYDIKK